MPTFPGLSSFRQTHASLLDVLKVGAASRKVHSPVQPLDHDFNRVPASLQQLLGRTFTTTKSVPKPRKNINLIACVV